MFVGKIFCDSCCHFRVSLPSFGYSTPVRICVACYQGKQKERKRIERKNRKKQKHERKNRKFIIHLFIIYSCFLFFKVANGTFETKRQEDFAKIVSFSNTLVRDHESKEWLLLLGRDATKDEV